MNNVQFSFKNAIFFKNNVALRLISRQLRAIITAKRRLIVVFFTLGFLVFVAMPPSVLAQKNAIKAAKKEAKYQGLFNGNWSGKGTVDYGFGARAEFEYELILEQKKDGTITGVSVTFLHIEGKRYCAKALVEGKAVKTYLNCAEKYNITEDKLPNSGWIPFVKMELILKKDGTTPTLEGLYECSDKSNGRIILTKKPPQV